jgi:hypothetical protein
LDPTLDDLNRVTELAKKQKVSISRAMDEIWDDGVNSNNLPLQKSKRTTIKVPDKINVKRSHNSALKIAQTGQSLPSRYGV